MTLEFEKAKSHFERALAALEMNDLLRAETELRHSLGLVPLRSSTLINLSAVLLKQNRWLEAKEICSNLLKLEPDNHDGLINLGISEMNIGNSKTALKLFNQVLAINPLSSLALVNKGNVLLEIEDFDEALTCFKDGLRLDPNSEEGLIGLGNLYNELKQYELGLNCFSKVLTINPKNYKAQWNKSLSLLRLGQYEEGWLLYESRWQIAGMAEHAKHLTAPLWLGTNSLAGKTILIHAEQGYGDAIQMSRYLPIITNRLGGKVIFKVDSCLKDLMKTLDQNIQIVDAYDPVPEELNKELDFQCPIMSLPLAFKTISSSIPNNVPYLHAEVEKRLNWHKKLQKISLSNEPFRIGIAWSGSGHYAGKKNSKRDLPFKLVKLLASKLSQYSIELHGIQKDLPVDFPLQIPKNLFLHHEEFKNFSDTAALIAELNLIVSIDTAVGHLAGALGQKTLLLIPDPPDFMALTNINHSPWYPSVTLIRQESRGIWPIDKIEAAILKELNNKK